MSIFEQIKERLTLLEALQKYTTADLSKFRPGRRQQNILCPFHSDKEPSFLVNQHKNTWRCFTGCGSGDVIDLVAKAKGLSLKETADFLANELDITPERLTREQRVEKKQLDVKKQEEEPIYEAFKKIIEDYHTCLLMIQNEADFNHVMDLLGVLPQRMPYFEYLFDCMKSRDKKLKSYAFQEGKRILNEN